MDKQKLHELRVLAAEIRLETLKVIASRGFGHVGGSMSMADAMAVLYGEVMHIDPKNPRWEDRDWFVLSKGHGGPVMYATLGLKGYYPMESAYTLNQPNTNFPSHTDRSKTIGVDLTTGSLGQGMSEAIGAKFDAFGWNVIDVADGNDVEQILGALEQAKACKGKPTCLILNTVKGKGATFAEPSGAHSSQPTKEQWDEAIAASEAALAAVKNEK